MLFRSSGTALSLLLVSAALVAGCNDGVVTPTDSGSAIDGRIDRDASAIDARVADLDATTSDDDASTTDDDASTGDVDASASDADASVSDVDASTADVDASVSDVDAGSSGADASTAGDAGMQPDGCVAPRCPPIPVGCEVVGGTACTCGTIVCAPVPCSPPCSRTEYCMYATSCGGAGTCEATPDFCLSVFDPVCGCDGMTYGNACEAARAGQSVASDGECPAAADCRTEGCRGGATCEECRGIGGPIYACIPRGAAC